MRRRSGWTPDQIPQLPPGKEPFPSPMDLDQRGCCNHLDIIPVEDVSGELVARLCLTCDQQWTIPVEVRWT